MNTMKTFLLMGLLTVLPILVGNLIGGQSGGIIAFMFAIVMNFGTYWFSDQVVLRMYGAHELQRSDNPMVFQITEDLAQRARLPMPKLYGIPSEQPNAFVSGRDPHYAAVAVTRGIVRMLSRGEL